MSYGVATGRRGLAQGERVHFKVSSASPVTRPSFGEARDRSRRSHPGFVLVLFLASASTGLFATFFATFFAAPFAASFPASRASTTPYPRALGAGKIR